MIAEMVVAIAPEPLSFDLERWLMKYIAFCYAVRVLDVFLICYAWYQVFFG